MDALWLEVWWGLCKLWIRMLCFSVLLWEREVSLQEFKLRFVSAGFSFVV